MHKSYSVAGSVVYDVGDRVKIVPHRVGGTSWPYRDMDQYLGTTMTIKKSIRGSWQFYDISNGRRRSLCLVWIYDSRTISG